MNKLEMISNRMGYYLNEDIEELSSCKQKNQTLKDIDNSIFKIEEGFRVIEKRKRSLTNLLSLLKTEDVNFKKRRVDYLSSYIDKNLDIVFPYDGFTSDIRMDMKYNNKVSELVLTSRSGKEKIPAYSEGKMLKQLTSFSGAVGMTECFNKKFLAMDEAFSASSEANLNITSKIIKNLVEENGFQIILIEQSKELYRDLKRREIVLSRDVISNKVSVVSSTDY